MKDAIASSWTQRKEEKKKIVNPLAPNKIDAF